MKKILALIFCVSFLLLLCVPALGAPPSGLTWDGQAATLSQIAKNTGYDMADANGNYKPLYYEFARAQWENGIFLGSNGSFDLDNPLNRVEGVVMTIRLLGKENEAKAYTAATTFTDVPEWAKPYISYAVQNGIANGYSATNFGAADLMSAEQFLTLVLRALGYKDGEDFNWNTSYDKALEIGLIGQPCHSQYSRSNLFLRDNAAMISYNAIFKAPTKGGQVLADILPPPAVKPTGLAPTATRAQAVAQTPAAPAPTAAPASGSSTGFSDWKIIHGDNHFQIHSLPGGNYNAVATYYLYFGEFAGTVDVKATISPAKVTNTSTKSFTIEHMPGGGYRKFYLSFYVSPGNYGQKITNTIKIQVGDYVYTDTVSVNGTLSELKITE